MENTNRILMLFLLLFAAIVVSILIFSKLGLLDRFFPNIKLPIPTIFKSSSVTPTLTPTPSPTPTLELGEPTPTPTITSQYTPDPIPTSPTRTSSYGTTTQVTSPQITPRVFTSIAPLPTRIPNTGLPTAVLPLIGTLSLAGVYLKRKG